MIIYGDTNAKVSHNRIKWNIMASTEVPDSSVEGHIGDVIVITSADISKVKNVATISGGEELQDNSINVYEDFSVTPLWVNESNGFDMYLFGTSQNIILDGNTIIANVYFYDGLTNDWVQMTSAYRDALNVSSFTGANINVDELWSMPTITDELNEDNLLPTIVRQSFSDAFNVESFSGCQLDLEDYISQMMPSLTENIVANNLTIV